MSKKKIIKIKNTILSSTLITTILISGLTGCQVKDHNIPQNSRAYSNTFLNPDINYTFINKENIAKKVKNSSYKAEDILVVKAYDPITEQEIYSFMVLSTHNNDNDAERVTKNCTEIFANTLLEDYIKSPSASIENNYYLYSSIFSDQSLYAINIYSVNSYALSGIDIKSNFKTVNNAVISNSHTSTYSVEEGERIISRYSYVTDLHNNIYMDQYNPDIYTISTYTYSDLFEINPNNILSTADLKLHLEELNNKLIR